MGDWFIGEIRAFSMSWAPDGWALCNGALLTVQQNQALYSLLGTTFGGTPGTNFNLPDLRGRTMVGVLATSPDYQRGAKIGSETVSLTTTQIPAHNHPFQGMSAAGTFPVPTNNFISSAGSSTAVPTAPSLFGAPTAPTSMVALNAGSVSNSGSGTGHNNVQPSLVVNYCIALNGIYPPRN